MSIRTAETEPLRLVFPPRHRQLEYNSCVPAALTLLLNHYAAFHNLSPDTRNHVLPAALRSAHGVEVLAQSLGILKPEQTQRLARTVQAMNQILGAKLFDTVNPWQELPAGCGAVVAFVRTLPGIWKTDPLAEKNQNQYIVIDPSDPLTQKAILLGSLEVDPQKRLVKYPHGHAIFAVLEILYDPNQHPSVYRTNKLIIRDTYTDQIIYLSQTGLKPHLIGVPHLTINEIELDRVIRRYQALDLEEAYPGWLYA